jgi:asparagine synthase (glutamine-hydrolysing)
MCGITGMWLLPDRDPRGLADTVARMVGALAHRGPDDRGQWVAEDAGVAIGQTRLAVVDLSAAGHQPMASPHGRFTVVFNGEIYNHAELRAELQRAGVAPATRGRADT